MMRSTGPALPQRAHEGGSTPSSTSRTLCSRTADFDTKDAFWHAKNVVVRNSTVKGEYLAWYCEHAI